MNKAICLKIDNCIMNLSIKIAMVYFNMKSQKAFLGLVSSMSAYPKTAKG